MSKAEQILEILGLKPDANTNQYFYAKNYGKFKSQVQGIIDGKEAAPPKKKAAKKAK